MNEQTLRAWLTSWLAERLDVAEHGIDPDQALAGMGLQSREVVELSGALEDLLDCSLSPAVVYRAPTIASLARHLTGQDVSGQSESTPGPAPSDREPVAVIGMGLRFPGGAATPEAYWQLLREGRDATSPAPPGRWDPYNEQHAGAASVLERTPTRGGYLTEDLAAFDADFFGLSAREAAAADPQQRFMLEVAWEALEHAGIPPRSVTGSRTGVFVGASVSDYGNLQMGDLATVNAWSGAGSALSVIANRISYTLGLRGPSLVVDTACSSSLVAVHQAVQSLRAGESELALAGGVNLLLSPAVTVNFEEAGVMAADGRCKTFSADADGYGRGEGCGLVVLKRLSAAQRDGDRVLAVIKGSAVNQDGASNGLLAPDPQAQEDLLRTALAAAALVPEDIDYIEAHGTGTALGDPIEVGAISTVLLEKSDRSQDLLLGSVKTNIGHLEAAAGIAGLIKVVLSLVGEELPPSLNFQRPNPLIPFDRLPLRVVTQATPWARGERARRAGVSGFGFGGTNAHIVLEEAPAPKPVSAGTEPEVTATRPYLVPLSAGSPQALRDQVLRLSAWLEEDGATVPLHDVVHTLALRRSHEQQRLAVVAGDRAGLLHGLAAHAEGMAAPGVVHDRARDRTRPVWVFSGQGSQWADMGRELLDSEPAFTQVLDELEGLIEEESGFSLRRTLQSSQLPTDVAVVQPLLFAMQLGLAGMWRSRGVQPAAVIGHSMGEVAAAVVAGALSTEDGVRVICRRSRLLTKVAGSGAMAVIEQPAEAVAERLATDVPDGSVTLAVDPSPRSAVISGEPATVRRLVAAYDEAGINARTVQVDVASHSPQMDELLAPLQELLTELTPRPAEITFLSTVGGREDERPACDAAYWADNLRAPVRLADAVRTAARAGHTAFVEISPHPVLARDVQATLHDAGVTDALVSATLLRDLDPHESFLTAAGRLYCHGVPLSWEALSPVGEPADLPRMSWRRQRYWTTAVPRAVASLDAADSGGSLLGTEIPLPAFPGARLWQTAPNSDRFGPLREHVLGGQALLPLSVYLHLALEAAAETGLGAPAVRDLTVHAPVVLDGSPAALQILVRPGRTPGAPAELEFYSRTEAGQEWTRCASARLHDDPQEVPAALTVPPVPEGVDPVEGADHYAQLARAGLEYGAGLRTIRCLWSDDRSVLAEADLPAADMLALALDTAFQALPASLPASRSGGVGRAFTVVGVDSLSLGPAMGEGPLSVRARIEGEGNTLVAALDWYRSGILAGQARGVRIRELGGRIEPLPTTWLHHLEWQPHPLPPGGIAARFDGTALIIGDGPVADAVAARLRAAGGSCRTVSSAGLGDFTAAEITAHLGTLKGVRHLVHCAADGVPGNDPDTAIRLAGEAVRLVQTLARAPGADGPRLWVVTSRAQAVAAEPTLNSAQAVLWGIGRSTALEHPELWGGLVDLDDPTDADHCAQVLVADLTEGPSGGQSAYRGGTRYVPRLVAAPAPTSAPRSLDADGSHLVVGATGRLGPALLDQLAHLGARHLVLVARRGICGTAADTVERLRARGLTVTEVAADVADEDAMRELFDRFGVGLPPLRGIYQAAFVQDISTVAEMSQDRLAAVLRPKITGTELLHRLAAAHEVEDFLCYSSTTALLGSQGLAHYAAASCFMDTLVHARRSTGSPGHVVNWGPWQDGLDAPAREAINATGMRLMQGERAVTALGHILGGDTAQVVVADADWPTLAASYAVRTPVPLLHRFARAHPRETTADGAPTGGPRTLLARSEPGRHPEIIRRHVHETVAQVLDLPGPHALNAQDNFFAHGMDSLMTMTILHRLKALAPGIRPNVIRENPTVTTLADAVLRLVEDAAGA
ncbi:SDR family NAD(P)-dependent oxidoreductase [Streptomyces tubercidicus]|uniref:SDR family NAD(P)-dependent oxidoreductase n=1 Tax=Streptomyces tubercidicus TaxID=47759 RepID=UPI00369FEF9D